MHTEALKELVHHAYGELHPIKREFTNPSEYNFHTAIELFQGNLITTFTEHTNNRIDYGEDIAQQYAQRVLMFLSEIQQQVNEYFQNDDAYKEKLEAIESSEINISPDFCLSYMTVPQKEPIAATEDFFDYVDSALYFNEICIWARGALRKKNAQQIIEATRPHPKRIKLKFLCDHKQVYDAFRWMREEEWISSTVEEIADFIFHSVEFKEGSPGLSTIRTQIGRRGTDTDGRATSARPSKNKRFNPPTGQKK